MARRPLDRGRREGEGTVSEACRSAVESLESRVLLNAPGSGWTLVFDDEFSGTALDASKWSAASPGWTMPNSASAASASQVSVGNGVLTLNATRTGSSGTTQFSSGSISSYQKYNFSGGYVEARIQLPSTPGSWPAFWGLYTGWPPEADIMEYPLTTNGGSSGLNNTQYNTNYHYTNSTGSAAAGAGAVTTSYDLSQNWHTFGMLWTPNASMQFFLDGRQVSSYAGSSVAQMANMYMILDYACGGWPGLPSTAQWPVGASDQTNVDWVRVYGYTSATTPAVTNAGFDTTGGWSFTNANASIVNGAAIGRTGNGDLHIEGTGEADQTITGLSPNTTYALTGYAILGTGTTQGLIGAKNYGGADTSAAVGGTTWAPGSVTFTTGPTNTSATVYCKNPGSNKVYFDDLALVRPTVLGNIADTTVPAGSAKTIPLSVTTGSAGPNWSITATSSNPALVTNADLATSGNGTGSPTLTVTPEAGQTGTATITVTATDSLGATSTDTFQVTVPSPVNVATTAALATVSSGAYGTGDVNSCAIATDNLITDARSGYQFVAFYDTAGNILVGRRAPGSSTWQTYNSGLSVPTSDLTDDHNVISIATDSAGYLHASWDMHNVSLKYAISTTPVTGAALGSLAFTVQTAANAPTLFPSSGATTNEVTYPQFYNIPNSRDLLFVYRNGGAGGGSGNGNEYFDVYDPSAHTWTNNLVINGEQTSVNAYLNRLAYDANNNVLMSWTWRATPNWQTNSNILFAQSPDNGTTWYQQGGTTPYTLPIIQTGSPASSVGQVVENIPQNSSFINQTSMTADAAGNPLVATWLAPGWNPATNSGNPNRQYVLDYYANGQWRSSQVTHRTSDTAIDSSGADVRDLGRPIVLVDHQGRVLVVTRSEDTAMGSYANASTPNNDLVVYWNTVASLDSASPAPWQAITLDAADMGAYEPTYDQNLWQVQNKLSLFYEPVGLSGETSNTVKTLDWDEQSYFAQLQAATALAGGSFETPALTASTNYQYDPSGSAWTFAGNAGIEANGSAFNAANAPDGTQAAFLQSNVTANQKAIGSVSQALNLPAGTYSVSFQAAQRSGKAALPIAFSLDGTQVGANITPSSTAWSAYTTSQFTVAAGSHAIQFTGVDSTTADKDSFLDAVTLNTVALAPWVATSAAAPSATVTGTSTALSVLGDDTTGESNLTYTWSTTGTPPAPVTFSANGTNAAKNTTATFTAPGTYNFLVTITDQAGLSATSSVSVTVTSPAPSLSGFRVNDGSAQRSMVTSLTLSFSQPVALAAAALTLSLHPSVNGGGPVGTLPENGIAWSSSDGGLTYTVSFSGSSVVGSSLADGVYDLTAHASLITATSSGQALSAGDQTFTFHRLFGDSDGNGTVNALDYARFKSAFGTSAGAPAYSAAFDSDANTSVNALDYAQFKKRFGTAFAYA